MLTISTVIATIVPVGALIPFIRVHTAATIWTAATIMDMGIMDMYAVKTVHGCVSEGGK